MMLTRSAAQQVNHATSPWLENGAPAAGTLARGNIRSVADIRAVEKIDPDYLFPGRTLYECIRAAAALEPQKPAFIYLLSPDPEFAPRIIAYRELLDGIERSANLFRALSGDAPAVVSIILPMLPEALIAGWGAATAGIGNPINPYLEVRQVAGIMNAAKTTVLVTTTNKHGAGVWDKLEQLTGLVPTLRKVLIVDSQDTSNDFRTAVTAQPAGLAFAPNTDPHAEATYLPTGGTTAAPKLVRMTHRGQLLAAWTMGAHAGAQRDGVVGHAMPNFHVGGGVIISLRAVLHGQTVLTLTADGFRNPGVIKNFWGIARRYRMTSLIATPATAAAILSAPNADAEGHCIQTFNCGGSTIPVELLRGFHARFGIWLRELWGMTEIHGMVTIHPDDGTEPVAGSVGRVVPWHQVKAVLVDGDNRFVRECAPGERGVLVIGGVGVIPGYVDPQVDAEFFVTGMPDGKRWANTGDVGTVDDKGFVWIFGRAKDVIIRGGHNIDPKMIEEVLVCHPAVQIAAAIGRPDAAKGEMPIAFVQLKEGMQVSSAELLDLCKKRVEERAAVPVEILSIDKMPMTAVGKINKPVLRMQTLQRVAHEVATRVIGSSGHAEVTVDESGLRPRAVIRASVATAEATKIEQALKAAFRDYEFQTSIEIVDA